MGILQSNVGRGIPDPSKMEGVDRGRVERGQFGKRYYGKAKGVEEGTVEGRGRGRGFSHCVRALSWHLANILCWQQHL